MKEYYNDLHASLYNADFRTNDLPDESVQMACTSPPYWGLRKYSGGLSQVTIWGDINTFQKSKRNKERWLARILWRAMEKGVFNKDKTVWIGAFGLEPTPEMYVEHTVEILREIRRVLRKDGVVFWNIGDSFYSSPSNQQGRDVNGSNAGSRGAFENIGRRILPRHNNLKPKDLCLIPFRVAIALQEDGWWVRSDIIWNKPNPMPESVTDRPTNSHEYILMLTKSAKYYWDADAVRTGYQQSSIDRADGSKVTTSNPDRPVGFTRDLANGANLKSVWTFPTQPYPEAHFAVFPEKLPELCIKAATPEVGCCSKCGAPWLRVTKVDYEPIRKSKIQDQPKQKIHPQPYGFTQYAVANRITETIGWQPGCKCNADKVPSIVLDPFAGAGTTLWVAKKLNRQAVGYELSQEYCDLIIKRLRQQVLL